MKYRHIGPYIMGIIKKVVCGHRIIQLLINIQRAKEDEVSHDEHIRIATKLISKPKVKYLRMHIT